MNITWADIRQGFAEQTHFCEGYSDLYFALFSWMQTAQDGFVDLLEAAWVERHITGWIEANLLVAAGIHAAVLKGDPVAEPLRQYYATAGGKFDLQQDRADFENALHELFQNPGDTLPWYLREGRIQTNEVSRSITWLVTAAILKSWQPDLSITFVDLGTSAGLNLSADYQNWQWAMPKKGGVTINGTPPLMQQTIHSALPDLQTALPFDTLSIIKRIGFDQDPLDLSNEVDEMMLRACLWGDQPERMARFDQAMAGYQQMVADVGKPQIYTSDIREAALKLPSLLPEQIQAPHLLLVFNSAVTIYLKDDEYATLLQNMLQSFRTLPDGVQGLWLEFELARTGETVEREKLFLLKARVNEETPTYLAEAEAHPQNLYLRDTWDALKEMLGY